LLFSKYEKKTYMHKMKHNYAHIHFLLLYLYTKRFTLHLSQTPSFKTYTFHFQKSYSLFYKKLHISTYQNIQPSSFQIAHETTIYSLISNIAISYFKIYLWCKKKLSSCKKNHHILHHYQAYVKFKEMINVTTIFSNKL